MGCVGQGSSKGPIGDLRKARDANLSLSLGRLGVQRGQYRIAVGVSRQAKASGGQIGSE